MSKIIITGASGGFGRLIVEALIGNGHQMAATLRDAGGRNQGTAARLKELGCAVIEMDVTSDAGVERGVADAVGALGGLDVVINNAGQGVLGLQEGFTADDWKRVFDINVFGVQRVCRAVLPHLKAQRAGLIINISSLLGRITVPFYGPYNASKWALEALSENYRSELSQLGIEVCVVEPGGFPTTFIDNLVRPSDGSRNASYGAMGDMAEGFLKGFEAALANNPAQDPRNVATAIAGLLDQAPGTRPFRTVVDKMGMGDSIAGYNESLAQVTSGIYGAFGIGHLLSVKR
jgi:NAD(P)-dependent dehydrogenase (short-subunit alcohol dehydrogenase family)